MDSRALMRYVEGLGVPLVVERGNRVFPQSGKASDVTRAFQRRLLEVGAVTRIGDACRGLIVEEGVVRGVHCASGDVPGDAVIVATGGRSYPMTGSTGDGYLFAEQAGHAVNPPRASLVPLETAEDWPKRLTGLSLRNVELCAAQGKKRIFCERGEMLFTHFGVSGPLVLSLSAHLPEDAAACDVWIDLKPALTEEQLDARLLREIEEAKRKQLATVLGTLMPHRLAEEFSAIAGVDASLPAGQLNKAQRLTIVQTLKHVPLAISGTRPIDEAVITRGGVDVRGVNPKTMESKLVKGLYFAGEVLDVDGYTGGFNLQIAFMTGYAAGMAAGAAEGERD
jgi:predicted Rossmann fold flavoprotein